MAKLKIYTYPDRVLAEKAEAIARVEKALHGIADDMLETMYDAPGIGLAANQVGILKRILVMDVDYEVEDLSEAGAVDPESGHADFPKNAGAEVAASEKKLINRKPIIIINPEIIYREGEITYCEGCLSVPEYSAEVTRAEKIKIKYQDIDGLEKILDADGLRAICLQHEMDHLDGKLFIERLSSIKKEIVKKRLIKERKQRESDEGDY